MPAEADGHKYLKGSYFETPLPSGAATPHQRMASVDEDRSLGRLEGKTTFVLRSRWRLGMGPSRPACDGLVVCPRTTGAELQAHLYQRLEHQRQHGSGLEDEELWHLLGFNVRRPPAPRIRVRVWVEGCLTRYAAARLSPCRACSGCWRSCACSATAVSSKTAQRSMSSKVDLTSN